MTKWYVLIFLILLSGIWIGLNLTQLLRNKQIEKVDLRIRREKITGRKVSKYSVKKENRNRLLRATGTTRFGYYVLTSASLFVGFLAGKLLFTDTFLSCATSALFLVVPNIFLELQLSKQKVYEAEKLENALSIITNSFLSSGDIITSVKTNLDLIEMRKPFEEFYIDVTYINANVDAALLRLAAKYDSFYLTQWVNAVILSQQDRKMMYILPSIIKQMNDIRQDQMEAATALVAIWRDFLMLFIIICAIPVVFRIVLYEWYAILTTSTIGRGFCLALIVSLLFSMKMAIKINRPISI